MKKHYTEKSFLRVGKKISKNYVTDIKPHFKSVSGYSHSGFSKGFGGTLSHI